MKSSVKPKYNAYGITLRPVGGITSIDIEKCLNYLTQLLKKGSIYGVLCISEKDDEQRHLHIALYYRNGQSTSDARKPWARLFSNSWDSRHSHSTSKFDVACKIKPMYNDDWTTKYLTKGDKTVVLLSCLPNEEVRKSLYKDTRRTTPIASDPFYAKLERFWKELRGAQVPQNFKQVSDFLAEIMYVKRYIRVIGSNKRKKEVAYNLMSYIRRDGHINYWDDPPSGMGPGKW